MRELAVRVVKNRPRGRSLSGLLLTTRPEASKRVRPDKSNVTRGPILLLIRSQGSVDVLFLYYGCWHASYLNRWQSRQYCPAVHHIES